MKRCVWIRRGVVGDSSRSSTSQPYKPTGLHQTAATMTAPIKTIRQERTRIGQGERGKNRGGRREAEEKERGRGGEGERSRGRGERQIDEGGREGGSILLTPGTHAGSRGMLPLHNEGGHDGWGQGAGGTTSHLRFTHTHGLPLRLRLVLYSQQIILQCILQSIYSPTNHPLFTVKLVLQPVRNETKAYIVAQRCVLLQLPTPLIWNYLQVQR